LPCRKRHAATVVIAARNVTLLGVHSLTNSLTVVWALAPNNRAHQQRLSPSHPRFTRRKGLRLFNEGRTSDIPTILSLREALKGPPAPALAIDCVGGTFQGLE
jgi:hypothetical protein